MASDSIQFAASTLKAPNSSAAAPSQSPGTAAKSQTPGNQTEALGVRTASDAGVGGIDAAARADTSLGANGKLPAGTVDQVAKSVERINEMMQSGKQTLTFQLDDESGRMVIRVIDAQTKEMIRQIPSEETLKFAQYVDGLVGLIFNKKA